MFLLYNHTALKQNEDGACVKALLLTELHAIIQVCTTMVDQKGKVIIIELYEVVLLYQNTL